MGINIKRRRFLKTGLGAAAFSCFGSFPSQAARDQSWFTGFRDHTGRYGVAEISADLDNRILFYAPLRLHGIAVHPSKNMIVAPARRPDTELYVFDRGAQSTRMIQAQEGRHYFGHGDFSEDGRWYFATESDFDAEKGVIGIYDVAQHFKRVGEYESFGIGPHEVRFHQGRLIIANGGILTHPETGRAKLNLDTMRPNLSISDAASGQLITQYHLPDALHQLSIRHMDVDEKGQIIVGLQDQDKNRRDVPLVWKTDGDKLKQLPAPSGGWSSFRGYIGSVTARSSEICVTSPRGNMAHIWGSEMRKVILRDVCGAAAHRDGFLLTSGEGHISVLDGASAQHKLYFDNHCQTA